MGSPSKIAHFDIHGYGASGAFHVPSSAHTAPNRIAAGLEAYAMGISVDAGRHGQTSALPLAERASDFYDTGVSTERQLMIQRTP